MVTISKISKKYARSDVKAVDSLSLDLRDGEIFGFVGPNGAGKTTTIKMLIGATPPDSGTIELDGADLSKHPEDVKRKIGYVPDAHDMFDRLTGLEFLNFTADVYGVDSGARRERIGRYLEMFDLGGAAGQYIRGYSRGMKQKLMISGSLLHRPRLWVLDEPLTGLDPMAARHLKEEMRGLCGEGSAVFFSSRVLDVVERICDRIGIIYKGTLLAAGRLDELRAQEADATLEQLFFELTGRKEETL